jgi:hypothetical protein
MEGQTDTAAQDRDTDCCDHDETSGKVRVAFFATPRSFPCRAQQNRADKGGD